MSRAFTLLAAATIVSSAAAAACTNLIAQAAAASTASPSWLDGLATYTIPTSAVPASPAVPADAPARELVFGNPLAFSVFPVNPASTFSISMEFLDDGGKREQSLTVGSTVVSPSFALPEFVISSLLFNFSGSAATSGVFNISIGSLRGPNAILSAFSLYSCSAADPPIAPPAPRVPTHDLPRLTPRPVAVGGAEVTPVYLHGTWDFDPAPSPVLLQSLRAGAREARASLAANAWVPIVVPGEYTLQGYRIAAEQPVVYHTTTDAPAAWAGQQTKLRCDGIYSNATVYVNGALVGAHLGGMTPFELDVTSQLAAGAANNITIVVVGASLADTLASGSTYATHDLGGITRKLYLFAVPPVSIADVHVVTSFADATYTAASLWLNISVANDGAAATSAPTTVDAVLSYAGATIASGSVSFAALAGASIAFQAMNMSVRAPPLWDPEHPRLHNLTLTLTGGGMNETIVQRVGFRDVAVAGNQIFVNGQPIKARGTTRHETHPLAGRSLWSVEPAGTLWERDITIFRDTNINYIRTSHYPPSEELMIAADELGMLLEVEHPFCWASGNSGPAAFNYTVQAQRETIVANRNHPSVILWSLGNESPWLANFDRSLALYLRELDSTRPFMFDGGSEQPIPPLDVLSVHYPSFEKAASFANASQPTLFGEYAHLNCYNRRELAADPGIRDIWGLGIEVMWQIVWESEGVLGACYWAGMYVMHARISSARPAPRDPHP